MRLFLAIELERRVKDALAAVQRGLGDFDQEIRWTRTEQMHLTLKFLGEVGQTRVPAVIEACRTATGSIAPFEMSLGRCGCFPERGRANIVWAGVVESTGRLKALAGRCENAFAQLGFAREPREFTPHLTLGRIRECRNSNGLRKWVAEQPIDAETQKVDTLALMQSVLKKEGAEYAAVDRFALCGLTLDQEYAL